MIVGRVGSYSLGGEERRRAIPEEERKKGGGRRKRGEGSRVWKEKEGRGIHAKRILGKRALFPRVVFIFLYK